MKRFTNMHSTPRKDRNIFSNFTSSKLIPFAKFVQISELGFSLLAAKTHFGTPYRVFYESQTFQNNYFIQKNIIMVVNYG